MRRDDSILSDSSVAAVWWAPPHTHTSPSTQCLLTEGGICYCVTAVTASSRPPAQISTPLPLTITWCPLIPANKRGTSLHAEELWVFRDAKSQTAALETQKKATLTKVLTFSTENPRKNASPCRRSAGFGEWVARTPQRYKRCNYVTAKMVRSETLKWDDISQTHAAWQRSH